MESMLRQDINTLQNHGEQEEQSLESQESLDQEPAEVDRELLVTSAEREECLPP